MNEQKPTVGRIVLFHEAGGPYASIVTAVNPDKSLELATFGKNSLYFQHGVQQFISKELINTEEEMKGKWTWPPRDSTPSIAPLPLSSTP